MPVHKKKPDFVLVHGTPPSQADLAIVRGKSNPAVLTLRDEYHTFCLGMKRWHGWYKSPRGNNGQWSPSFEWPGTGGISAQTRVMAASFVAFESRMRLCTPDLSAICLAGFIENIREKKEALI